MRLSLYGVDETGERVLLVPPALLDQRSAASGLSKEAREDLQAWSFLASLTADGKLQHSGLRIDLGGDPPDRVLRHGQRAWGLELCELTIADVRRDLAIMRSACRTLEQLLRERLPTMPHLVGRTVAIAGDPRVGAESLLDPAALFAVVSALAKDEGFVGEGVDVSQGLPQQLGGRGFYGSHGGFIVQVYDEGQKDHVVVASGMQAHVTATEAVDVLMKRIDAKDIAGNDAVLITCGLPDQSGFTCPLDTFLFRFVADLVAEASPFKRPPKYLKSVVLNHWASGQFFEVSREPGANLPWQSCPP